MEPTMRMMGKSVKGTFMEPMMMIEKSVKGIFMGTQTMTQ
jgi:hypothetical protein